MPSTTVETEERNSLRENTCEGNTTVWFRHRSLSSVARTLLPRAEELHGSGMPWRQVASQLRVSYSAIYLWRRLARNRTERGRNIGEESSA
jgi:hypothetical protein